jgi:polyphosphate kinase
MNTEGLTPVAIKDAQAVPEGWSKSPTPAGAEAEPALGRNCGPRTGAGPAIAAGLDDSSLYIHRELSQLQFNIRVLEQALDESYPLLERLKFLLIFSSNLDEFFEIRVAGLKKQITFAREQAGADGLQPHQALARISELVHGQVDRQYAILNDMLLPELEKHRSASSVAVTGRPSSRPGCAATSATRSPRSSPRSASTRPTRSRCW